MVCVCVKPWNGGGRRVKGAFVIVHLPSGGETGHKHEPAASTILQRRAPACAHFMQLQGKTPDQECLRHPDTRADSALARFPNCHECPKWVGESD